MGTRSTGVGAGSPQRADSRRRDDPPEGCRHRANVATCVPRKAQHRDGADGADGLGARRGLPRVPSLRGARPPSPRSADRAGPPNSRPTSKGEPMTNPLKTLDTGTACTPTPRDDVTGPGMPASSPATDYGVACATGVHADTNSP